MKKFLLLLVVFLGGVSFSTLANAEEPSFVKNGAYLTKEIDPNEVEIYDEQGNLVDSDGIKLIEYIPTIQPRSTFYSKYVTTYRIHNAFGWPNSLYLRWNGGWQGTVYYTSYYANEVLWGISYQVNYGGTLYRWDV